MHCCSSEENDNADAMPNDDSKERNEDNGSKGVYVHSDGIALII